MELWKDIEEFENYQVSSWGRFRSANGILKPYHKGDGRHYDTLNPVPLIIKPLSGEET